MKMRPLAVMTAYLMCATMSVRASPAEIFEFDAKAVRSVVQWSLQAMTIQPLSNPVALTRTRNVSTGLGISTAPALKFDTMNEQTKTVEPASRYSLYTGLSASLVIRKTTRWHSELRFSTDRV